MVIDVLSYTTKTYIPRPPLSPNTQEKNVQEDVLDGKVGRIYMPQQSVDGIALRKMKGLKRERREAAAAASGARKKQRAGIVKEDGGVASE